MKLKISLIVLLIPLIISAQESFKRRYYVKEVHPSKKGKTYSEKSKTYLYAIEGYYEKTTVEDGKIKKVKTPVAKKVDFEQKTFPIKSLKKSTLIKRTLFPGRYGLKSNVKLVNDTLYVNHWPYPSEFDDRFEKKIGKNDIHEADKVYFFLLKNRKPLKLGFREWTFNILTVPLKIRFGDTEEFTTGANLGALFGHTWGSTKFLHRKKVGNKQFDSKFTTGFFLGADKLEFSFEEGVDENGDPSETSIKTGLVSFGTGALYSYQKITIGFTAGFDFGLSEESKNWKYQGKPWIGVTLGYNLFSF